MPLDPGTKLGAFEITGLLGKGGMGEVYRARDTKLGREVAIKVLPEALASDAEYLKRFEREARTLASLDHPNIAAIYDFVTINDSSAEGQSPTEPPGDGETDSARQKPCPHREKTVRFLVMQLVDGDTLSDVIRRSPMPLREAIPVFIQIARGLDAAHAAGIVHRDLKPANIKITARGEVKVLDFGIAKDVTTEEVDPNAPTTPMTSSPVTGEGLLIGTPQYMSPEQARGKPVDRRTDIWAFGCCLYEALTGSMLFNGETVTDVVSEIIQREPDWDRLPKDLPGEAATLLRRCLEKDANRRLKDAGDVAVLLETVDDSIRANDSAAADAPNTVNRVRIPALAAVVVAIALAGAAVYYGVALKAPEEDAPSTESFSPTDASGVGIADLPRVRYTPVALPADQPLAPPLPSDSSIALSPDANLLAYRSQIEDAPCLVLRRLGTLESVALDGTRNADRPAFSPDGTWLTFTGFYGDGRHLMKLSLQDGAVQPLVPVEIAFPSDWADDGYIYYTPAYGSGLMRVSSGGGAPEAVTELSFGEMGHSFPDVLPGSKAMLYTSFAAANVESARLLLYDLTTGDSKLLFERAGGGTYISAGYIIYAQLGRLMAAPFDLDTLTVVGPSFDVTESRMTPPDGIPRRAVTRSGNLAYAPADLESIHLRTLSWVDLKGNEEPLPMLPDVYDTIDIAADGRDALVTVGLSGTQNVWLVDLERYVAMPLVSDLNRNSDAVWAGRGSEFLFSSNRSGAWGIHRSRSDNPDYVELVQPTPLNAWAFSVAPDAQRVLCSMAVGDNFDLFELSLMDPPTVRPLMDSNSDEAVGRYSPDGKWIAYMSNESGENHVYVRKYPELTAKTRVSVKSGVVPLWSPDGTTIYYSNDNEIWAVRIQVDSQIRPGEPRLVYSGPIHRYALHPDGSRFLIVKNPAPGLSDTGGREIVVVENWFEEVRRRQPHEADTRSN